MCNELDKKVIGLYARGISVDDIRSEIDELYRVDLSPAMISKITDKVMETAISWQNRSLVPIYPIVYMDAIHFKAREKHRIVNKAAYICMALDMKGYKDIILACMDGLKGLPEAIKAVFPDVNIQSCVIHQIRNSIKYVASKDSKAFMKDLKCVYQATGHKSTASSRNYMGKQISNIYN